ncbi:hypothetical protein [Streptomyces sp. NPDC051561]|uniref:hypothetical protein n=1 Tax=Streptomyces sp. NPDC051561 TaxID=3365658 RepID=UPI0037BB2B86
MNTFLDYLTVALVFVLIALPSLLGHARDLRIDRQLRRAERPASAPAKIANSHYELTS